MFLIFFFKTIEFISAKNIYMYFNINDPCQAPKVKDIKDITNLSVSKFYLVSYFSRLSFR